ncbi:MAG TPA: CRTAC1 family protein [Planctomycetota bacterium]|nr:CRTAC1 family protein [Planctomycetota bacterium]
MKRALAAFLRGTSLAFWTLLLARSVWAGLRFRAPGEPVWLVVADRAERDGPRLALLALGAGGLSALLRRRRDREGRAATLPLLGPLLLLVGFPVLRSLSPRPFEDVTGESGVGAPGDLVADSFDAACADVDGDGDPDLLVNHHNLRDLVLLRNEGNLRFRDVSRESGLVPEIGVGALLGEPRDSPPEGGFDLFHDPPRGESALGKWRVRWRAGPTRRRFEGTVETNGPILAASAIGARCEVAGDARSLRFDSAGPSARGALDFETKFLEGTYRFAFRADGRSEPERVRIGPRALCPKEMPFRLVLGDPHGVAFGDADGDGDVDLFVAEGAMEGELRPPTEPKADRFFRNEGGRFTEGAVGVGISNPYGRGRCAAWLDLDRDGLSDLFVGNLRQPSLFFRGVGGGRFAEEGAARGLALEEASCIRWFDLDGDGDFDLLSLAPLALYRNENGRLVETADAAGLPRGAFEGRAAQGFFPEVSASFADVDGDGDQDLYLAGPEPEGSRLFERTGETFADATARSGLPRGVRHAAFGDYDDDGRVDVYLVMQTGPSRLFRNEGGGWFADRTRACGLALDGSVGRTALWLDADGDGTLDLLVLDRTERRPWDSFFDPAGPHRLFRNRAAGSNRWLEITLRPRRSGAGGIGSRVRVVTDAAEQVQVAGDRWLSVYGQSLAPLHFGLGGADRVRSLEVLWPSGRRSLSADLSPNRGVVVEEP